MVYNLFFDDIKVAEGANQYDTVRPTKAPGTCQTVASLAFQDNFEAGFQTAKWSRNGACYDHSLQVVDDACASGNHALRIRSIIGRDTCACSGTFARRASGSPVLGQHFQCEHREEIEPLPTTLRRNNNEDVWVGYRVYFPTTWPTDDPLPFIWSQMIAPDLASGRDMSLTVGHVANETPDRRLYQNVRNSTTLQTFLETDLGALASGWLRAGHWHNVVEHYKRSTTTGRTEVWIDGVKRIDWSGINSQAASDGARWKLGLYRPEKTLLSRAGEIYDVYFDDVKIAKGSGDLRSLVAPTVQGNSCATPP